MSSASAILTQLEAVLGAIPSVGTNVSHSGYDILDTMTGNLAIVIRPGPVSNVGMTFGRSDATTFTFRCEVFVKDSGNQTTFFEDQWQIIDDVLEELAGHDDLNASCNNAILSKIEPEVNEWNVNGQLFQRINCYVMAEDYGR
jgi:hypothetical protein